MHILESSPTVTTLSLRNAHLWTNIDVNKKNQQFIAVRNRAKRNTLFFTLIITKIQEYS